MVCRGDSLYDILVRHDNYIENSPNIMKDEDIECEKRQ
jgi:hypothetical protein